MYSDMTNILPGKSDDENQETEWKWSWNEEYLKWLCGYANVAGGTLYIGVNDDGYVVGLDDARSLLERLPNKILDRIGIVASVKKETVIGLGNNIRYTDFIPERVRRKLVNRYAVGELNSTVVAKDNSGELDKYSKTITILEKENPLYINEDGTLDYISITVDKYPFAISFDGKYYKRSGSTLQLLNGFELQNFLLQRAGKTWDAIPVPDVTTEELDPEALDAFRRKAVANNRMSEEEVNISNELLLRNLKLFDGDYLTRAAVLLFHPDPEQYITGSYIKLAFFAPAGTYGDNTDADIIYHDDIHGPLMTQIDKVADLLYTKYFKALISYEKLQRIETYMFTKRIARELLLNPINHKDYARSVPIQISVYDDHLEIFNVGSWPEVMPLDDSLYQKHESIPYNPRIADVFYRSGEIDSWGTGFLKIRLECERIHAPLPVITQNSSGVFVHAAACDRYMQIYNLNKNQLAKKENMDAGRRDMLIQGKEGSWIIEIMNSPLGEIEKYRARHQVAYEHMLEICSTKLSEKEKEKMYPIVKHFEDHNEIDRATAQKKCNKSSATALRYLDRLCEIGAIIKLRKSAQTKYRMSGI